MQTTRSPSEVFTKVVLAVVIALFLSLIARKSDAGELVVYTYDSLVAKEGLGPILKKAYEKKTGVLLKFITVGDAGQLLSRIQLDQERKKGKAHIVLGLDQHLELKLRDALVPLDRSREGSFMKFVDREWWSSEAFVPYDFGIFAFIADTKKLPVEDFPKTWNDLLKRRFKKSLLLEDPRTSSPGLSFVIGSASALPAGDEATVQKTVQKAFTEFWKDLRSQWLVLAPSWGQAYAMFEKGDAPLVWSYVTSEAYHRSDCAKKQCADPGRYRAVIFSDGHPVQVEGAAILKNAPGGKAMRKRSLQFLELLTSGEIQNQIAETQWMMPVRLGTKIPTDFQALPVVKKRFPLEMEPEKVQGILDQWNQAIRSE